MGLGAATAWAGFVLVVVLLSGCVSPADPAALPASVAGDPRDVLALVHDIAGNPVPATLFPGALPVMAQRYVGDARGLEPTLGIGPGGTAFYAAAEILSDGYSAATLVMRSRDGGLTWQDTGNPRSPLGQDPFLHVDPATGRVFALDLTFGCHVVAWSDDEGATWNRNPSACGAPLNDHPTLFTGPRVGSSWMDGPPAEDYPSVVYLCSNQFTLTVTCTRSLDGGRTFVPVHPVALHPEGDERTMPRTSCGYTATGHGRASQAPDGTAYLPHVYCDIPRVHLSRDAGITWEEVVVDTSAGALPFHRQPDQHDGSVGVDSDGNAYYAWLARDGLPRLSTSVDQGRTWSAPIKVAAPGVTAARYVQVVAGDPGRVAVFYLGTAVPGGYLATASDLANATWHGFVGMALDALAPDPVLATTLVNPPDDPLVRGPCFGRCGGAPPEQVYDFMDLEMDPSSGAVWVALADVCTERCAEGVFRNRAAVGVQVGGSTLLAGAPGLPSLPVAPARGPLDLVARLG